MEVKTDREFIAWCRADQFDHLPEGYFDRLLALSKGSPYYGTTALCDIAELRLELAEAREDTERRGRLVKRMAPFVRHSEHGVDCDYYAMVESPAELPCTCGLDDFRRLVEKEIAAIDAARGKK